MMFLALTAPIVHSLVLIQPAFRVLDQAALAPYLSKCIEHTKAEEGCLYYGWTLSEDKAELRCREAYVDGNAASTHFDNALPIVGEFLEKGYAELMHIRLQGSAEHIADVKPKADPLGAAYYETWDSFQNAVKTDGPNDATANFCTVEPTFTLHDKAAAEPFMAEMVEATRAEKGCVYYGWTICGNKLFCREAYVDGPAVVEHFRNAVPLVGAMLESGAASLDKIEIHGPASEVEKTKVAADPLGAAYFTTEGTFSNFKLL
jgi:quinol monooxygenase YgiN